MRKPDEIQRAHDMLLAVALEEVPIAVDEEQKKLMRAALDALCWVMNHSHNVTFAENLRAIDAEATRLGFRLTSAAVPIRGTQRGKG